MRRVVCLTDFSFLAIARPLLLLTGDDRLATRGHRCLLVPIAPIGYSESNVSTLSNWHDLGAGYIAIAGLAKGKQVLRVRCRYYWDGRIRRTSREL